jgi:hypothetical protein
MLGYIPLPLLSLPLRELFRGNRLSVITVIGKKIDRSKTERELDTDR